ncbi:hypothetical protein, partial [Rhizobium sp. TBD182]|uniref:hypothetical protein n=1 Tax=Rhizobium sp. TBD182 TaxID=1560230 RepID=UPI001AEC9B2D
MTPDACVLQEERPVNPTIDRGYGEQICNYKVQRRKLRSVSPKFSQAISARYLDNAASLSKADKINLPREWHLLVARSQFNKTPVLQ